MIAGITPAAEITIAEMVANRVAEVMGVAREAIVAPAGAVVINNTAEVITSAVYF